MQDGSYVKEMERLANQGVVMEVDGKKFSSLPMKPVFFQPRPSPIIVRSLTAIRDYLGDNVDKLDPKTLLLHVASEDEVRLVSKMNGEDLGRDSYLTAKYDGTRFKFGEWMTSEQFIIAVNALFLPSSGRDTVLNYVARIKVEDESEILDDGVSQAAKARVGIKGGLTETERAPSRVVLVPYRTFREVEQPESEFIFRIRLENGAVKLSLHEADGGAWRAVAMQRISAWLAENGEANGLSIIA